MTEHTLLIMLIIAIPFAVKSVKIGHAMDKSAAIRLAKAAVEDARRPVPAPHLGPSFTTTPDHRTICLCNAIEALISAIGDVGHG